jgi:hypothetical protein
VGGFIAGAIVGIRTDTGTVGDDMGFAVAGAVIGVATDIGGVAVFGALAVISVTCLSIGCVEIWNCV